MTWQTFRRYTILLSEKGMAIQRRAFGVRWTKFYPLAEIHNLHFRYNPVLGKPPKQWELIFDRYALAQNVPIPMTLPDAQNRRLYGACWEPRGAHGKTPVLSNCLLPTMFY